MLGTKNIAAKKPFRLSAITVAAIEAYGKIYGNHMIPTKFLVPSSNPDPRWPEATHGMSLGLQIPRIRRQYKVLSTFDRSNQLPYRKLERISFVFNVHNHQMKCIVLALKTYKHIYLDLDIPKKFCCPENDHNWPEIIWGMKIGYALSNIRNRGNFPELRDFLDEIGVDFSPRTDHRGEESILLAVERFKEIYGHTKIPMKFKVPSGSSVNPQKESVEINQISYLSKSEIKVNKSPAENEEISSTSTIKEPFQINKIGTTIKQKTVLAKREREKNIARMLEFYKEANEAEWPKQVRDLNLGYTFHRIYYSTGSNHQALRELFEAKGYFKGLLASPDLKRRNQTFKVTLKALEEYKLKYGNLDVPKDFVIPLKNETSGKGRDELGKGQGCLEGLAGSSVGFGSPDLGQGKELVPVPVFSQWSPSSLGMKLGTKVRMLRSRKRFIQGNRDELDAISFQWDKVDENDV